MIPAFLYAAGLVVGKWCTPHWLLVPLYVGAFLLGQEIG